MIEQKKVGAKKKLTLNRETLRSLSYNDYQVLEGVVGGTNGGTTLCVSRACPTVTCGESDEVCNSSTC
jgi:hypothetical protein